MGLRKYIDNLISESVVLDNNGNSTYKQTQKAQKQFFAETTDVGMKHQEGVQFENISANGNPEVIYTIDKPGRPSGLFFVNIRDRTNGNASHNDLVMLNRLRDNVVIQSQNNLSVAAAPTYTDTESSSQHELSVEVNTTSDVRVITHGLIASIDDDTI